jgi:hypothetical protein
MSDCSVYTCSLPLVKCSKVGSIGNGKYSDEFKFKSHTTQAKLSGKDDIFKKSGTGRKQ